MSESLVGVFVRVLMSSGQTISGEILNVKEDRFTIISGADVFDVYRNHIAIVHLNASPQKDTKQFKQEKAQPQQQERVEEINFPQNKIGSEMSEESFFLPSDILHQTSPVQPTVDDLDLSAYFGGNMNSKIDISIKDEDDSRE